jgi:glucoamylase
MGANGKQEAPGNPGIEPRWTSSAKVGIGTAVSPASRLWFTLAHGIVNEIYYPRVDVANTRDVQFLITAPGYFSEEKRHTTHVVDQLDPWAPAYRLTNTCEHGRYRLIKDIVVDPDRSVLLQHVTFQPLVGAQGDYRLYLLAAPHIANCGYGNTAWVDDFNSMPMLMASREATYLAVACSSGFMARSVGFVGVSNGWQDITHPRC